MLTEEIWYSLATIILFIIIGSVLISDKLVGRSPLNLLLSSLKDSIPRKSVFYYAYKRFVDCILSAILIILLFPFFIMCSLLIKIEDGGPITYKKRCIGIGGKEISYRVFRTLRMPSENIPHHLDTRDSLVTKTGMFLRRSGLDYLPMITAVFSGKLTFVGLSREIPDHISESHKTLFLHDKPGIISLSSVNKGLVNASADREKLDLEYLQKRGFITDIKVMLYALQNTVITTARTTDEKRA